jgi:hypothetical protein
MINNLEGMDWRKGWRKGMDRGHHLIASVWLYVWKLWFICPYRQYICYLLVAFGKLIIFLVVTLATFFILYINVCMYVCMYVPMYVCMYVYGLDAPALLAWAGAITNGSRFIVRTSTFCVLAINLVLLHH